MCIPNRFTSLLSVCLLMRAAFSVTVLQGVIMTPRWLTWQDLRQPGEHPDESGHDIQSISAAEPSAQDSAAFTFPTSCRTSQTGRHQFTLHYITLRSPWRLINTVIITCDQVDVERGGNFTLVLQLLPLTLWHIPEQVFHFHIYYITL